MALRTQESLQRLFTESKRRQQRLKEQEREKYKKASQSVKKALADKLSTKDEKTPQKAQEQQTEAISRILSIYNSRYIERFADEDELYQTREELEKAMPHCINWDKWDSLVNNTRKELEK